MPKTAQDRGLLNVLREKTNISGKILESLNPEFAEMMERLRATDEKIRTQADGVKDLVRSAISYTNRRDYLTAATTISAFHERCRVISAELQKFISSVDMKHYKFLLDQFDDEHKDKLFGYDPNKELKLDEAAVDDITINAALKKQAGLSDWWFGITDPITDQYHNLTDSRGRAMKALEKRFSIGFLKTLKADTAKISSESHRMLSVLVSSFSKLATGLAKRNVDQYIEAAKKFISLFTDYHGKFVKFYNKNIVPLKEQQAKLIEEKRLFEERKAKEVEMAALKNREDATKKQEWEQSGVQEKLHNQVVEPNLSNHFQAAHVNNQVQHEEKEESEKDENIPFDLTKKKTEAAFIADIEKTADPKTLMYKILAFSENLEDIDSDRSLKLLAIAEGIAEDYKIAGVFDFLKPKEDQKKNLPAQEEQLNDVPVARKKPIEHNIPEGRVDKKYSAIPILASIQANNIRITANAARHISTLFIKRLYDLNMDAGKLNQELEKNIINSIKSAIPKGIVLNNNQSDDSFNPLDRQLEIYTYINLKDIDNSLTGIAKFRVACRLSLSDGTLSLRNIEKTFSAR